MGSVQAERKLIQLSAGVSPLRRESAERAGALMAEVDWARLAASLSGRRLLPTLGPRILEWSGDSAPAEFQAAVTEAVESARRQAAFLQFMTLKLIDELAEKGVRSVPLKGPLLGEEIYGDAGRRLSSDVDLLVDPGQLGEAVAVARAAGYDAPRDHLGPDGLPLLHLVLWHERAEFPPLELHWRVHWYERRFATERLLPAAATPPSGWRPARSDELIALLLFYARDGFIDLRLASDLAAWWDRFGAEVSAAAVLETIGDYPALGRVVAAAAAAAERVVGIPRAAIVGERELGARERVAARLAEPNPTASRSQLYADAGLVDGLLAPPGGLKGFVDRQLLPPKQVLDQQAAHGGRRRRRSSTGRAAGTLLRYLRSLSRLLGAPRSAAGGVEST